MSWVTIVWSMEIATALTLVVIHLVIWSRQRTAWASLLFGGRHFSRRHGSLRVPDDAVADACSIQRNESVHARDRVHHLHNHRVYMCAGRMWSVIILRAFVLALNFLLPLDVNYQKSIPSSIRLSWVNQFQS